MKAVILAGGKGTRLAPYTAVFPKPLVPIGHQPILEIILKQLVHYGFNDVTLTTGYLAELIKAYFANIDTRIPGLTLNYVYEDKPTGTAGSLASVPGLTEPFLVMNGDVLTSLDYRALVDQHLARGAVLTIALHNRVVKTDFGVVECDDDGLITGYREKPENSYLVSMGVYVYSPRVLDYIERDSYLDLPTLVLRLLEAKEKVVGIPVDAYWLDIGRHDDYGQAQEEFERIRHLLLPSGQ
ncbi:MAG: nucleotidyl transferase [Stygiobacter sp.]|nr:MAG: nucleotidyl transferase [Stygiobacter sp.]